MKNNMMRNNMMMYNMKKNIMIENSKMKDKITARQKKEQKTTTAR